MKQLNDDWWLKKKKINVHQKKTKQNTINTVNYIKEITTNELKSNKIRKEFIVIH